MQVKMKVGDLVRNTKEARCNPVVNESRDWTPIPAGQVGVVVGVRQTNLNATYSKDGKGDVYVDVILTDGDGGKHRCGNYLQGFFEVVV